MPRIPWFSRRRLCVAFDLIGWQKLRRSFHPHCDVRVINCCAPFSQFSYVIPVVQLSIKLVKYIA